ESCALVAALFLGDLHEQDLPALDDFLDAILLARLALDAIRNLFHGVFGADGFDLFLLVMIVVVIIVVVLAATASHVFRNRIGFDHGRHFAGRAFVVFAVRRLDGRCLGGRRLDLFYLLARTAAAGLCLRLFGLDGFNLDRASIFGCFCASLFRRRRLIVDDGLFGFSGIGDWFGRVGRFGVCDHLLL